MWESHLGEPSVKAKCESRVGDPSGESDAQRVVLQLAVLSASVEAGASLASKLIVAVYRRLGVEGSEVFQQGQQRGFLFGSASVGSPSLASPKGR